MQRIIFHVDINSYFATMLQQENPALRGKPVGVIKGEGRTCIIAASKEAKKLGVSTGARVPEAREKIPELILVPAEFNLMLSATRRMKSVFQEFSPVVHIFSLDEAFLDLTGCEQLFSSAPAYAQSIQKKIKETLGEWVTCNVGISHNKFLAKMAGEIAPKGKSLMIDEGNLDEILRTVEFKDVCGVGMGLQKKLTMLGVSHPYEINLIDDETLQHSVGPHWAQELRKIGLGKETHFFSHKREVEYQKSVGRTITGYKLCDDEEQIRRVLLNLLEEATHKLRAMDLSGRKIGISLWGHDRHWGEYRTLGYWVRHTDEIWKLLYEGMYRKWERSFPVIKFGVWIGDCRPTCVLPQSFLPEWKKRETVYSVIDQVNDRFGAFTVHPARLLGGPIIKPEVTGYLGDRVYLGL